MGPAHTPTHVEKLSELRRPLSLDCWCLSLFYERLCLMRVCVRAHVCACPWQVVLMQLAAHSASAFPQVAWRLRPACSDSIVFEKKLAAHAARSLQLSLSLTHTTHKHTQMHIHLPVWLLCACVREARQRDSSRLHTPTPQMQGPRSRILRKRKEKQQSCLRQTHF